MNEPIDYADLLRHLDIRSDGVSARVGDAIRVRRVAVPGTREAAP